MDKQDGDDLFQRQWSTDPGTAGFDLSSGSKWIFPENYPKRDYQYSIIQTSLFNNTLICLPTGLGKTFIAAVVMYNFWRWYPKGRIVFLAPTKPLVAQQIYACQEIMGIPSEETIELTGSVHQNKRAIAWTQKRIIFATPQTFQKDLQNGIVPCELIKCLIFDEAHKALGKHAYSEIIRLLTQKSKYFRVLGLSATPGSKIDQVCEVIKNLLISKLELRDDTSPDIVPYINSRSMSKIVIKMNPELTAYKIRYLSIISPHFNVLVQANIIRCDVADVSKARIFNLMNSYKSRQIKDKNHGFVMKTFTVLLTMFHAYELLTNYGLRAFYNFYQNHTDKFWYDSETNLKQLLNDIKEYIGDFPIINVTEELPEIPNNLIFGHDKFFKLKELLEDHFKLCEKQSKNTRAIIFIEYRDIVNEVFVLLLQCRPLIRPQMFVGRAGLKQKQQIQALEDFRNNKVNVLISTSVGEEGLDVGEVDLIICFDIISSTPIRLVQRIGRTGRKRSGNVVMLVTDSHELKTLNQAMAKKDSMNSKVLKSITVIASLYKESPRMVPLNYKPECFSMFIKIQPKSSPVKTKKKLVVERKKKKNTTNNIENIEYIPEPVVVQKDLTNFVSKDPSSVKLNNQQSLLKFFSERKNNNENSSNSFIDEFVETRKNRLLNNNIKFNDIKLLSDDNKSNEFLILCAMKKSKIQTVNKFFDVNSNYILNECVEKDIFSNFLIPSIDTLSCISNLNEYISSSDTKYTNENSTNLINSQDNLWDCLLYEEFSKPVCANFSSESKYSWNVKEPAIIEKNFEDLLDENTESESLESNSQKKGSQNEFGEKNIFDDLLDTSTDEEDNTILEKTVFDEIHQNDVTLTATKNNNNSSSLKREANSPSESSAAKKIKVSDEAIKFEDEDTYFDDISFSELDSNIKKETKFEESIKNDPPDFKNDIIKNDNENKNDETSLINVSNDQNYLDSDEDLFDGIDSDLSPKNTLIETAKEYKNEEILESDKAIELNLKSNLMQIEEESPNMFEKSDFFESKSTDSNSKIKLTESGKESPIMFDKKDFFESSKLSESSSKSKLLPLYKESPSMFNESDFFESKPSEESTDNGPKLNKTQKFSTSSEKTTTTNKIKDVACESYDFPSDIADIFFDDLEWKDNVDQKDEDKLEKEKCNEKQTEMKVNSNLSNVASTSLNKTANNFAKLKNVLSDKNSEIDTLAKTINNDKYQCLMVKDIENIQPDITSNKKKRPGLNLLRLKKNQTNPICDKDGFLIPDLFLNSKKEEKDLNNKKKETVLQKSSKYDNDEPSNSKKLMSNRKPENLKKKKIQKKKSNDFIFNEAEVSEDEYTTEGSSEEDEENDLEGFVSYTQDVSDAVDMRGHYLKTIRSPVRNGAFLFKKLRDPEPNYDIYSQVVSQNDDTYLNDTFCVKDDDCELIELSDISSDESFVEEIDTRKRKAFIQKDYKKQKKPKRIIVLDGSSSEDEIENLRKQIMENSIKK